MDNKNLKLIVAKINARVANEVVSLTDWNDVDEKLDAFYKIIDIIVEESGLVINSEKRCLSVAKIMASLFIVHKIPFSKNIDDIYSLINEKYRDAIITGTIDNW